MVLLKQWMNLNVNQVNNGLIQVENFTIILCKNDNDILVYLTCNEGKSIVAERFVRTLKGKIYKKMAANDSKYFLGYLNKLVDEYSNTYHRPIDKKPISWFFCFG